MAASHDHIFRAYDIRGIFNKDLDVSIMQKIGIAFGTYMKQKNGITITLGGDIRASTNILQHAFLSGILTTGVNCELVKESPLGITLFNSFNKNYIASAFITASHLPPDWNGIKFYWGEGIGFSPEENEELYQIYKKNLFEQTDVFNLGSYKIIDPYSEYVSYLKTKFNFQKNYNIAIDCGNGATSLVVPELYEELGFNVSHIFSDPDHNFPNRTSEPTEESLSQLSTFVKDSNVLFGAGFDGDGDRCVFTDENGIVISSDVYGLIISEYLIQTQSEKNILINMECSLSMEDYLKSIGANPSRIKVGHSFLSLEAKNQNAIWGIESSGHAIYPNVFLFDDALILPLMLVNALEYFNLPLSKLIERYPPNIKKRYDLKCDDKYKFQRIKDVIQYLDNKDGYLNTLDGVALTNDNGRILVRASNTSPKVRITIEALNQQNYDIIEREYLNDLTDIIQI